MEEAVVLPKGTGLDLGDVVGIEGFGTSPLSGLRLSVLICVLGIRTPAWWVGGEGVHERWIHSLSCNKHLYIQDLYASHKLGTEVPGNEPWSLPGRYGCQYVHIESFLCSRRYIATRVCLGCS